MYSRINKFVIFFFIKLFIISSYSVAEEVLIIWDNSPSDSNTVSLKEYLEAEGHTVTLSTTSETAYNGSNPSPNSFDDIIHLNGETYDTDMPSAGQSAILDWVNEGGTFINMEWNAYEVLNGRMQILKDLVGTVRTSGNSGTQTITVISGQENHKLATGLPTSFTVNAGANIGTLKSGHTEIFKLSNSNGSTSPALTYKAVNLGHTITLGISRYGGTNPLQNSNIQKMILNSVNYALTGATDPITDNDVVGSIDTQSQLAKSSIYQSTSTVSNRLSYLRQNKDNQNLSKQNIKLDFGNAILMSLTNELLAKNDKSIIPDNWSSWSDGSLSSSKIGDSTNSSSSETDAQALALGFDTKLNDNDLLGFAIQYGKSDTDVGSSGTNVDSENINVSIYRTRPLNDNNFIEGMFGIGVIESDLTRISGANTLTGSRNGTQIFGSINYGKTLDKGDFNLTPIARVDLGYTELDAYSETGTDALALSYAKQTIESGLASVGLQFSNIVKFNNNKLKPFGSIEYGMDFSNSSDAKMNYVSDTSTIYTYTQGANSNHLITSVVGFEYITINNLNIISSYKRIQGNESEQTDILNVSINFKSTRETEYAMSVDGSEDLKAGFDISKNINGFDLKFNANQSLSENSDKAANVSLSRSF